MGWENNGKDWFYATFIHIDVKATGQVWLQHDGTDLKIGETLLERGVLRQDLVIGFHSPYVRTQMDSFVGA